MTPMFQQFHAAKEAHPGMVVFFQNGEFYELFEDDAVLCHRVLGLTLTKREETPMAGFPLAKLDHHLRQMLAAGHRVAVVEQTEPPGDGKKIIRREVTRVVTLGTVTEDELLDPRKPNHLSAVVRDRPGVYGLAWLDLTAGTFHAVDVTEARLADECSHIAAAECLLPEDQVEDLQPRLPAVRSFTTRPAWTFDATTAVGALYTHFQVSTLSGFGFQDNQPCLRAAGGLLHYLQEVMKANLGHIRRLTPRRPDDVLTLDETTRRSLELTRTLKDNLRDGSFLSIIDRTVTPMGARFLHEAILAPLRHRTAIEARHDAVDELLREHTLRGSVRELLDATSDLHRLTTRASTARATPKDLGGIARTLRLLPKVKAKITGRHAALLQELETRLELVPDVRDLLDKALVDDPPYGAKEGGIIREGYDPTLDNLRNLSREGKDWIARYQAEEVARTGISSLKVGYTEVMGYFIEVTNANEGRVPSDYLHERTLKGGKRYVTPQLKEYEEKVLTAQDKSRALELELFLRMRDAVAAQTERLLQTADVLSTLDFLGGLAELAAARNFIRPVLTDEPILDIRDGRHPVLDQTLPPGMLVPNDTRLSETDGTFWLITGPNMAGKSTFIRQTALLVLLAQIGSFVPAKTATIGLVDRIFTRVGASDELSRGLSTFMVEMTEAANILNNATPRSLVILDEIGRGTSTYDGLALAWAITEHLHEVVSCRVLFATHYHELAGLAESLTKLRNYNVRVQELENDIVFLHKIEQGNAGKSYGIHVARLAGVPAPVLARAEEVLASLENRITEPTAIPIAPQVITPPEKPRRKAKPVPSAPSLFGGEE